MKNLERPLVQIDTAEIQLKLQLLQLQWCQNVNKALPNLTDQNLILMNPNS